MRKLSLGLVTTDTDIVPIPLQHGGMIRAMGGVALDTLFPFGVRIEGLLPLTVGLRVALLAEPPRRIPQHGLGVGQVRTVAEETRVWSVTTEEMVVKMIEGFQGLLVT